MCEPCYLYRRLLDRVEALEGKNCAPYDGFSKLKARVEALEGKQNQRPSMSDEAWRRYDPIRKFESHREVLSHREAFDAGFAAGMQTVYESRGIKL